MPFCNMNIPCTGKRNTMIRQYFSLDRLLRAENQQLANQKIYVIYHSRVRGPSISPFSLLRSAHIFPNVVLRCGQKWTVDKMCIESCSFPFSIFMYVIRGEKRFIFHRKRLGAAMKIHTNTGRPTTMTRRDCCRIKEEKRGFLDFIDLPAFSRKISPLFLL